MGVGATVKHENGRYIALDSAAGIKRLLGDWHALKERRYCGDMTASDLLIDLETALERAGLTDRQRQAIALVYFRDMKQEDAGKAMGVGQQRVARHLDIALVKIARVYESWNYIEGGENY